MQYLVILRNTLNETQSTICKSNDEVATLISNLDVLNYSIEKIEIVSEFVDDIKSFCAKPLNLETGLKEEVKND